MRIHYFEIGNEIKLYDLFCLSRECAKIKCAKDVAFDETGNKKHKRHEKNCLQKMPLWHYFDMATHIFFLRFKKSGFHF